MEKLLTVDEAAAALGLRRGGLYALIYKKKLPAEKVGWTYRIKASDVEVARNRNKITSLRRKYADEEDRKRAYRERIANDPVFREKINKRQREGAKRRYADPEYRRKILDRSLAWQKKKRLQSGS